MQHSRQSTASGTAVLGIRARVCTPTMPGLPSGLPVATAACAVPRSALQGLSLPSLKAALCAFALAGLQPSDDQVAQSSPALKRLHRPSTLNPVVSPSMLAGRAAACIRFGACARHDQGAVPCQECPGRLQGHAGTAHLRVICSLRVNSENPDLVWGGGEGAGLERQAALEAR